MKKIWRAFPIFLLPMVTTAYETMYEKTEVGKIELKEIPGRIALEATTKSPYFQGDNNLFRTLFRYISKNEVAMTIPVEAEMKPGRMRFFLGRQDVAKKLASSDGVKVRNMTALTVVSIGIRGSYTNSRFKRYEAKLENWLSRNTEYEAVSDPYGVYWNSPFVPGFFKRSEIHVEVKKKGSEEKQERQKNEAAPKPDES
ncbi:MAG: heme-binding protein [Lentisphaeria bacterium]